MSTGYVLELLDQEDHQAVQVWELDDETELSIGRARTCSIQLASRFVSRIHARLLWSSGGWLLVCESEQGVLVGGRLVEKAQVVAGEIIKLGAMGPSLRLEYRPEDSFDTESTIHMRPGELALALDLKKRDAEVEEIAKSDFFQDLEKRASALKAGVGRVLRSKKRSSSDKEDREGESNGNDS